ncbi:polymer-forming cytoskeletal protein [candidate division KSB1 bacterium]|nr:polymer-forming cytoskeletal protein [candidate division KSB1 bacterium]
MLAKKDEQTGEILTWLGKDSYFEGKLTLKHSLRIDGKVKGRVETTDSLTIGRDGEIQGDEIKVKNAVIGGTVIGNITATGKITLEANSVFRGEMKTKKLVIHDGAVFEGHCSMSDSTNPGTPSMMNQTINFDPSRSTQDKKIK